MAHFMTTALSRSSRLQQYLDQDPANLSLRRELIDACVSEGRLDDARQYADQGLAQASTDPQLRYLRAIVDHHQGHLPEARTALQSLLDEGLKEPVVCYQLARIQFQQADWAAATATLQTLLAQPIPADIAEPAALLHVRSLHRLAQLDAAIERAEQFLQLQPDSVPIRSALATLYIDAQRLPDASRLYAQAEQQGQLDAELLAVGGILALDAADVTVALARFEQSIAASPNMGRAHLGLGLAHAADGRIDQAIAALTAATQAMPTHLGSWHALAWMQLVSQQVDAAEATFNQALAIDRNFGDTYGGLAIVAAVQGDRAKAEELIRIGRKLDPRSLNVGTAMALLQHGGRLDDPEFLQAGLQMLHTQALAQDAGMRAAYERLMQRTRKR